MARVLVLWTRPYHLSAEEAERWAQAEAARLLEHRGVERADLTRLTSASEHHPGGWDWLLELHLADDADHGACADDDPCAEWLADLRVLGTHPAVLLAERPIGLANDG
jgi:hypothetical protein